jgi:predicted RNase H-like HicB family nuclease
MTRNVSYFIMISRSATGYTASCPAFPDLIAPGTGARQAYARLKSLIKGRLLAAFAHGRHAPRDPVVQTRTLRLDLWYLREQEELR